MVVRTPWPSLGLSLLIACGGGEPVAPGANTSGTGSTAGLPGADGGGSGANNGGNGGSGGASSASTDADADGASQGLPESCLSEVGCGDCIQQPELGEHCDNGPGGDGSCTADCKREYEVLFDARAVPAFYLTIPRSSWDVMATCGGSYGAAQPPECDYFAGSFHAVYDPDPADADDALVTSPEVPVGIRRKGRVSWRELGPPDANHSGPVVDRGGKPSMKVKFDFIEDERFLGLTRLTLNNSVQDPSGIRERLGYRVLRAAGVHAPLATSAELYVKGPDDADYVRWGLYVNLQTLDKRFVKHHFGEVDGEVGNLYDTYNDTYFTELDRCDDREQAGESSGAQEARFQLETNEDIGDTSDLTAAIDSVYEYSSGGLFSQCRNASYNADNLVASVEPILDLDAFLREFAGDVLITNWDGYAGTRNNFKLYHDLIRDRFVIFPWGIDQTFGWQDDVYYPNWAYGANHRSSNRDSSHLMNRCAADTTGCWPRYLAIVEDAVDAFEALPLQTEAAAMAMQIRDKVDWSPAEFERHLLFVDQYLATRAACVRAGLAGQSCATQGCPAGSQCDADSRP